MGVKKFLVILVLVKHSIILTFTSHMFIFPAHINDIVPYFPIPASRVISSNLQLITLLLTALISVDLFLLLGPSLYHLSVHFNSKLPFLELFPGSLIAHPISFLFFFKVFVR